MLASSAQKARGATSLTVPAMLARWEDEFPREPAVSYYDRAEGRRKALTYSELVGSVRQIASGISSRGYSGDRIALVGQASREWLQVFLAVLVSGNTAVVLDRDLPDDERPDLLARLDLAGVFFAAESGRLARWCAADGACGLPRHELGTILQWSGPDVGSSEATLPDISEDSPAVVVATSGTTGRARLVPLSHRNVCSDVVLSLSLFGEGYGPTDTVVPVLPTHHMFGLTAGLLAPLACGAELKFAEDPRQVAKALTGLRPSIMIVVPMIAETFSRRIWAEARRQGRERKLRRAMGLSRLLRRVGIDLTDKWFSDIRTALGGRLHTLICGGAAIDPALVKEFDTWGVSLLCGYGVTECSPVVACSSAALSRPGSVGWAGASPHREVKIVDGEICVRGDIVMAGYIDDPKGTQEVFSGEWFRTGDLGRIDSDGYLFITGRAKNLIILADGNNVAPEGLEAKLEANPEIMTAIVHVRLVGGQEVLAVTVHPDPSWRGEAGGGDARAAVSRVVRELNRHQPAFKRIQHIEFSDHDFEKTALGKVKRYTLSTGRKDIRDGLLNDTNP